jgi:hypothetical protein
MVDLLCSQLSFILLYPLAPDSVWRRSSSSRGWVLPLYHDFSSPIFVCPQLKTCYHSSKFPKPNQQTPSLDSKPGIHSHSHSPVVSLSTGRFSEMQKVSAQRSCLLCRVGVLMALANG